MLVNEMRALRGILKRLERNRKRLVKQAEAVEKICDDFDKRTFEYMLTFIQ